MSAYTLSLEECCKSLRSYDAEVEGLMAIVNDPSKLTPDLIEEARSRLKNLKACLEKDRKRQNSEVSLTHPEQAVYVPAVTQARADLLISANSRPSRMWFSSLYGIQVTLRHALGQLENWKQ